MLTDITALQARIAELEAENRALRAKVAVRSRSRKPAGDACQYCGDAKSDKGPTFLGLPLCADPKACASRLRRATKAGRVNGYCYDDRYSVNQRDAAGAVVPTLWFARFDGHVIGIRSDRGEARRLAYDHRNTAEHTVSAAA